MNIRSKNSPRFGASVAACLIACFVMLPLFMSSSAFAAAQADTQSPSTSPQPPLDPETAYLSQFQREAKNELAQIQSESEQQRAARMKTLQELQEAMKRTVEQARQSENSEKEESLSTLLDKALRLKGECDAQSRSVNKAIQGALARAVAKASAALETREASHKEDRQTRKTHRLQGQKLLASEAQKLRTEARSSGSEQFAQENTQIVKTIKELALLRGKQDADEKGAAGKYRTINHKGHRHRELVRENGE